MQKDAFKVTTWLPHAMMHEQQILLHSYYDCLITDFQYTCLMIPSPDPILDLQSFKAACFDWLR